MKLILGVALALTAFAQHPEPQAFVPSMRPLERVVPKNPVEPLPASTVRVSFLLTIDPSGSVANAEALTGNPAFRQAALDAVRRARFNPVLREGKPVYAYTQLAVQFIQQPPRMPFKSEEFNPEEEMLAASRVGMIQRRFPRSPQQALADLEQDSKGADPITWSYALSGLAKAAARAEVLDKASRYAAELLNLSVRSGQYEQGIYDGHMVQGLVALRRGNIEQAKQELRAAGATKGSPVLNSFGPSMELAKQLIEKGEGRAVLDFFAQCATFWKMGQAKLDNWAATVRGGGMPDFTGNLGI